MTKKELSQLYYLKKEIKQQQKMLEELEALATSCTSKITWFPHGTGIDDKIGNYAAQIADLKTLIELNLNKCLCELNRLNQYIQSVEDSDVRTILTLRYSQGLSWQQIAQNMGVLGDGSTERKKHNRFLKLSRKSQS